jgi:hypothetical protein
MRISPDVRAHEVASAARREARATQLYALHFISFSMLHSCLEEARISSSTAVDELPSQIFTSTLYKQHTKNDPHNSAQHACLCRGRRLPAALTVAPLGVIRRVTPYYTAETPGSPSVTPWCTG